MKIPCKDCAVDAPENFSSMFLPKSKLFKTGWHIHKVTTELFKNTNFKGGEQYYIYLDDELFNKQIEGFIWR